MGIIRDLLKSPEPLVVPGVYDALGATIARKAGFRAMFQTGYGTSAVLLGMPDYGFLGAAETVENARRVCRAARVPVIVDADTGYGNALSVWKLVRDLEDAGAAGIFLEDQVWPKRCGHMQGKQVVGHREYAEKLRAALDARRSDDFVIVARTDARATAGLDEAIRRAKANLDIGADIIFVEAPHDKDELRQIGESIDAPLVANMIEGGATPVCAADELKSMGFDLVLYPLSILYAYTRAAASVLDELKRTGGTTASAREMADFAKFNDIVDLESFRVLEQKYASADNDTSGKTGQAPARYHRTYM